MGVDTRDPVCFGQSQLELDDAKNGPQHDDFCHNVLKFWVSGPNLKVMPVLAKCPRYFAKIAN